MNKVSPEFLPSQNEAQQEIIEDLIKKRNAYNEALKSGRDEESSRLYAEYRKLFDEIKIGHPEYSSLNDIDQMIVDESQEETRKHLMN